MRVDLLHSTHSVFHGGGGGKEGILLPQKLESREQQDLYYPGGREGDKAAVM